MKKQIVLLVSVLALCFIGCGAFVAPEQFIPVQKVEFTTLKTLQSAKAFREFALSAAGAAYKNGLMGEEMKQDIIKTGNRLQLAINSAAEALILYHEAGGIDGSASLEERLADYQAVFNRFMEIVTPYIRGKETVDV